MLFFGGRFIIDDGLRFFYLLFKVIAGHRLREVKTLYHIAAFRSEEFNLILLLNTSPELASLT